MKRRDLLQHLASHACELVREGARHSWWQNRVTGLRTAIPRHVDVNDHLARKICRDLGIADPR